MKKISYLAAAVSQLLLAALAFGQAGGGTGQIAGTVKDPDMAVVPGVQVVAINKQTNVRSTTASDGQGGYTFSSLQPGGWTVQVNAPGFATSVSPELQVTAAQTTQYDFTLALGGAAQSVTVSAGTVENAYRVDNVAAGGPLGNTPILDLPYQINVISRQLIDDTQSRNFKEAAKYLPLVSFQEMQGPEVLRPETRGLQGSNMQNDMKDGMGIAVTTPSALEEYEQVEVVNGLAGPLYGPANPSGMFNFITKRPTDEPLRELELDYEGDTVATAHTDLSQRFGKNKMFGIRTNLLVGDGNGYVTHSQLRRQLAAVAGDARVTRNTTIEGNYSYYNVWQHGYPGWFSYTPGLTSPSTAGSKSILIPEQAPDPTREGYGQSFSGVNLTSQIGEVRVKHDFSENWHLSVSALHQIAQRNINTAVNSLLDNKGDYQSYNANSFSSLAPQFQVVSDLAYLTGRFHTGRIRHEVSIGTTGYRFASWTPVNGGPTKAAGLLCTAQNVCEASIANPVEDVIPAAGLYSYTQTSPENGIYVSSVIHQQGFSFGDNIMLTPKWFLRIGASQDWTWVSSYSDTSATGYSKVPVAGGYSSQGVSPTGSIGFKPRADMTIYASFVDSIQAPDVAGTATAPTVLTNASQPLPQYRSKEGEIGYKLRIRRINFSTALFRLDRPFPTYVTGVTNPVCGKESGTANCETYEISGDQRNYGIETMMSGRIVESLMVTGGLTVLNPKLTDTGIAATNDRNFVGIPDFKSNVLAEYRVPFLTGVYFTWDWQHVGRRAIDDINSAYTPQYNTFDFGIKYATKIFGKLTTWRATVNNATDVHYWSTLGPGSITGASTGSYLAHLGDPLLATASMRYEF